jgi:hypothetical protein
MTQQTSESREKDLTQRAQSSEHREHGEEKKEERREEKSEEKSEEKRRAKRRATGKGIC